MSLERIGWQEIGATFAAIGSALGGWLTFRRRRMRREEMREEEVLEEVHREAREAHAIIVNHRDELLTGIRTPREVFNTVVEIRADIRHMTSRIDAMIARFDELHITLREYVAEEQIRRKYQDKGRP